MEKEKDFMENERSEERPILSRAERRKAAAEAERAALEAEKEKKKLARQDKLDKINPGKLLSAQGRAEREARAEEKSIRETEARREKLRRDSELEARKTQQAARRSAEQKPEKKAEKKSAGKKVAPTAPPKEKKRGKPRIGLMVAMAASIVLLLGVSIAALIEGHRLARTETSFENVCVGTIPVGGMSREQIGQTLIDQGWEKEQGGTLTVRLPAGIDFKLDYFEAGASYTAEQMADIAASYGHDRGDIAALLAYLDSLSDNAVDVSVREIVLNEDYIRAQIEAGAADFEENTALSDYQLDRDKGVMRLLKGGGQMFIDRDALREQVTAALLRRDSELSCSFAKTAVTTPDFAALGEELEVEPKDA